MRTGGTETVANLGLDIPGGARLAAAEKYGDWYRDPWGWPELSVKMAEDIDAERDLGLAVRGGGEHHLSIQPHFHLIDMPKSRLGVRPAVVQDPLTRLAYLSAVQGAIAKLHDELPDWVYGWRARGADNVESGAHEWGRYVSSLPNLDQSGFGLVTDLTSFFASIHPEGVAQLLENRLGKVAAAHVIMDVVRAHHSLSTRSGLPQRSFASAVLANAILKPIDDTLHVGVQSPGITSVRRWMDDISAEGEEGRLYSLLLGLQERARQLGLEINASKTSLSSAFETSTGLRLDDLNQVNLPMKAVAAGIYDSPTFEPDIEVLDKLEASILHNPLNVSRTIGRAVLVSLKETQRFDRCLDWLAVAPSMPHIADSIGRYLRSAAEADPTLWEIFGRWFSRFEGTDWARLDWVISQYALVFPSQHLPESVLTVLTRWLETGTALQQIAVSAQRISSTSPELGRDLIHRRTDRITDPLVVRVLALGLLQAGEGRGSVEPLLRRHKQNGLLLKLLEQTGWKIPAVVNDFDFPDGN